MQARSQLLTDETSTVKKLTGTVQDITELYSGQQQLLATTAELENTDTELQRFAYVVSHGLQEPLRKIRTFASLLQKELDSSFSDKHHFYLEKIIGASTRMQHLIDDVLHFSSLQKEQVVFETVDLNARINQLLSDIEVLVTKTGAVMQADALPQLEAAAPQITQLFQNLISNAIKFRFYRSPFRTTALALTRLTHKRYSSFFSACTAPAVMKAQALAWPFVSAL